MSTDFLYVELDSVIEQILHFKILQISVPTLPVFIIHKLVV